jgi:UDP-glucose 4-epimerase
MDRARPGTLYNVGGGTEATMRDAIATLEDVSGQRLDLAIHPAAAGDVRRTAADTRRIEHDLGWRATTELGGGLRAQWEWASVRVAAP